MNTNDAKEYLSSREIPQLFEVSICVGTFVVVKPKDSSCK